MIATVLGLVADLPEGAVDAHGHLWIDRVDGADPTRTFVLDDEHGILGELAGFSSAGGAAVIDCQPPRTGRNLGRLAAISRRSGVAIIASTGFHLRQYYGSNQATWQLSEAEATSLFERDLNGASDSGIRGDPEGGPSGHGRRRRVPSPPLGELPSCCGDGRGNTGPYRAGSRCRGAGRHLGGRRSRPTTSDLEPYGQAARSPAPP